LAKVGYGEYIRFIPAPQAVMIVMICGFTPAGPPVRKASWWV